MRKLALFVSLVVLMAMSAGAMEVSTVGTGLTTFTTTFTASGGFVDVHAWILDVPASQPFVSDVHFNGAGSFTGNVDLLETSGRIKLTDLNAVSSSPATFQFSQLHKFNLTPVAKDQYGAINAYASGPTAAEMHLKNQGMTGQRLLLATPQSSQDVVSAQGQGYDVSLGAAVGQYDWVQQPDTTWSKQFVPYASTGVRIWDDNTGGSASLGSFGHGYGGAPSESPIDLRCTGSYAYAHEGSDRTTGTSDFMFGAGGGYLNILGIGPSGLSVQDYVTMLEGGTYGNGAGMFNDTMNGWFLINADR